MDILRGLNISGQTALESLGVGYLELYTAVDPITWELTPKVHNEEMLETAMVNFVDRIFAHHPELEAVDMNFAAQVDEMMTHYRRIHVRRSEGGKTIYFHQISPNIFPLVQTIVDSILTGFVPPLPHGHPPEGSLGHAQANLPSPTELLNVAIHGVLPQSSMHHGGQWT